MSDFTRKIQYLKGLADGMNATDAAAQWISCASWSTLWASAESIDDLFEMNSELNDYVESIDDDLYRLESDFDGEMKTATSITRWRMAAKRKRRNCGLSREASMPGAAIRASCNIARIACTATAYPLPIFWNSKGYCPNCGEPISIPSCEDADALPFLRKEEPHEIWNRRKHDSRGQETENPWILPDSWPLSCAKTPLAALAAAAAMPRKERAICDCL